MATKYPLIINNLKFLINPTSLKIGERLKKAQLDTQGGTMYHFWYEEPTTLDISGKVYGDKAYRQLLMFKQQYHKTNKVSRLYYKTNSYEGFINSMDIDYAIEDLGYYKYQINFQLLNNQTFNIEDFVLVPSSSGIAGILNKGVEFLDSGSKAINKYIEKHPESFISKIVPIDELTI